MILTGPDLTREKVEAEARVLAGPSGGWLQVRFEGEVAYLLPPVSAAGLEEEKGGAATPSVATARIQHFIGMFEDGKLDSAHVVDDQGIASHLSEEEKGETWVVDLPASMSLIPARMHG